MNRAGHASSGLAVGVAVAGFAEATPTWASVLTGGVLTSAAALLPDLDHPNSTVTHRFGPVTVALSRLVRGCSAAVYRATKGPRDEPVDGTHRHLTHTVLAAVAAGMVTTAVCRLAAAWHPAAGAAAIAAVVVALTRLAGAHFGRWALAAPAALIASVVATGDLAAQLDELGGMVGVYVGLGWLTHCLGDALTEHGCPLLWPLPIRGETFYEIRLPAPLRFRTGSVVERVLVVVFTAAALVLAAAALLPAGEATSLAGHLGQTLD